MNREKFQNEVKNLLHKNRLTYHDVAKAWCISESSVKRIMASGDISLNRLLILSELIGFTVSELFKVVEGPTNHFSTTESQDLLLAQQPDLIYLLIRLKVGDNLANFSQENHIPFKECLKMARSLETVGLCKIDSSNHIILTNKGPFFNRDNGHVHEKLLPRFFRAIYDHFFLSGRFRSNKNLNQDYFSRPFELYMTDKTYHQFIFECNQLHLKFAEICRHENMKLPFKSLKVVSGFLLIDQCNAWRNAVKSIAGSKLKDS